MFIVKPCQVPSDDCFSLEKLDIATTKTNLGSSHQKQQHKRTIVKFIPID